ncbi:hypothetical protein [Flavobacterium branchiicola]|uniref:Uncharacterized protein n=1 Tax=Flavobacterium branchiicola TaxID=1114875 RepID=A0ABV9PLI2_9FLAO|nr:hypothetical protein [Flavobacterium branchiicola]MBS7256180.1 hypothetical protein [Flavobacterium branchiicola]
MKKAALIFGLFSLVTVATSFEAPEKTNTAVAGIDIMMGSDGTGGQAGKRDKKTDLAGIDIIIMGSDGTGGQAGKRDKKTDYAYNTSKKANSEKHLSSFVSDSQLTKSNIKLD